MRSLSRMAPTLAAVEALWRTRPDYRLGQLLWAIAGGDPFHIEEDEIQRRCAELLSVQHPTEEQPTTE